MMIKATFVAATLAVLLAGPAHADDRSKRADDVRFRGQTQTYHHNDDWRGDHQRYHERHFDRRWRQVPPAYYRSNGGYRAGYEAGWRDASWNCRFDYRPGRWYRDPRDSYWYFGFQFDG